MELTLSAEQEELRESLRRFLEAKSPTAEVRRLMETATGYDAAVWGQMAEQLGLQGIAIPEEYGGAGFGLAEQMIVLEEMGRALLCAPYLSSAVIGANVILASDDKEAREELLPGVADGSKLIVLADAEQNWPLDPTRCATTAERDGGVYRVTGRKPFVLDGHIADVLLVVARTDEGLSIVAVNGEAPGVSRRLCSTLDRTRKLAAIRLDAAPGRLIGTAGAAGGVLSYVYDIAAAALAAEQTGGADRCLEMAVEYAKVRHQFGRPIGSFQAIKHKCADLLVQVEAARSATTYAAWAVRESRAELSAAAAAAKAVCSEAYVRAAQDNIQIHGGIGFTWEHDAHLYLRRAKSSQLLFGTPEQHRERLAALMGMS